MVEDVGLRNFSGTVDGSVVMQADDINPRDIPPGQTTIGALAAAQRSVVPCSTVVHGVKWIKQGNNGSGRLIFPANFSGEIATEFATKETLAYYGAKLAEDNNELISVEQAHQQTTFTYSDDYLARYVEGEGGGATLERHEFCHTDRPEQHINTSGHFVIAKFLDGWETTIELTGFKIPTGQTLFIPAGVIHTNSYLKGRWNTMLAAGRPIDDVRMEKAGRPFSFKFTALMNEETREQAGADMEKLLSSAQPDFQARPKSNTIYIGGCLLLLILLAGAGAGAISFNFPGLLKEETVEQAGAVLEEPLSTLQPVFQHGVVTLTGCSLLHRLVLEKNLAEIVRRKSQLTPAILDSGCKRRTRWSSYTYTEVTALFLACWYGQREVVDILLDMGADPNSLATRTKGGWTQCQVSPLYEAARNSHPDICRSLLAHGARLDVGESPMKVAETGEIRMILRGR